MKATTISVLLEGSTNISMYVKIGKESCNLSVRFDQGKAATICGYPQDWLLHDYPIDQYDSESPLGVEYQIDFDDGELPQFKAYVGPDEETIVLEAAIKGIKRQAKDPMFKNDASEAFRAACIKACELAIKALGKVAA